MIEIKASTGAVDHGKFSSSPFGRHTPDGDLAIETIHRDQDHLVVSFKGVRVVVERDQLLDLVALFQ